MYLMENPVHQINSKKKRERGSSEKRYLFFLILNPENRDSISGTIKRIPYDPKNHTHSTILLHPVREEYLFCTFFPAYTHDIQVCGLPAFLILLDRNHNYFLLLGKTSVLIIFTQRHTSNP